MASKALKWTGIGLLITIVGIQLVPKQRNEANAALPTDIITAYAVPQDIANVLHKACYDCHSNHTEYPWYYAVQPVAMWMDHHLEEGKHELNFSEFATYKLKRKLHKLEEIAKEVEEGEMPLSSYTLMHANAKLNEEEKRNLIEWTKALSIKISMTETTALK